jgi:two-component system, OmpR family, sensor histidine kinase MtrB
VRVRRPYLGLRARIAIAVVLVTFTATVVMAFAVYRLQAGRTTERFGAAAKAAFTTDLQQIDYALQRHPGGNEVSAIIEHMQGETGLTWSALYVADPAKFQRVAANGLYNFGPDTPVAFGTRLSTIPAWVTDDIRPTLVLPAPPVQRQQDIWLVTSGQVRHTDVVLVEFLSLQSLQNELSTLRWQLAAIVSVVALLGVAAALLAAKRIQRPIRTVAAAARVVGDGWFDVRLPVRGRDDLADLASSFNVMAERLGVSVAELQAKDEQQRRFVADVAHDLRTPVAAMVAAVDSLPGSPSRAAELLGAQARRLARLVEDLLEMSHFDAGVVAFQPELVELPELVADAIDLSAPATKVEVVANGDTALRGDPRRLHTIVCNLLTNATRHGAEPITVTIDGTQGEQVTITVADSGPGIPDELKGILFDRFVRGDQARMPTEGSGLGLAIAQENARLHDGRIEVVNAGGAVFTVTVPRSALS